MAADPVAHIDEAIELAHWVRDVKRDPGEAVRRALLDYERVYMLSPERLARSVAEHEAIIAALEAGDHARAADLVRANYTSGMPEVAAQLSDARAD